MSNDRTQLSIIHFAINVSALDRNYIWSFNLDTYFLSVL
ncbi:hypothetical protein ALP00_200072 [Pseudomonas coronafaciens pv. porri]|nr:hypothetical protein ALP00_200072 [Pseudomonas coronafaciens pv. porri]